MHMNSIFLLWIWGHQTDCEELSVISIRLGFTTCGLSNFSHTAEGLSWGLQPWARSPPAAPQLQAAFTTSQVNRFSFLGSVGTTADQEHPTTAAVLDMLRLNCWAVSSPLCPHLFLSFRGEWSHPASPADRRLSYKKFILITCQRW